MPLILTPELLNYLRNHFLRGEVPWVAEADLLLSELCRPVGYEQFAFAPEVRAYLIGQMREQIGETAMEEVVRLLIRYVHHLSRTSPHLSRDGLQAEQWSAMVFLKEKREDAVAEIAEAFRDHLLPVADTAVDWTRAVPHAELARLVRITDELAAQLGEYPDLLRYASDVARLLAQPDGLASLAKKGRGAGSVVSVAGVALPDAGEGRNKPVFSEVEEPAQAGVSCISDGLGNETSSSTEQAPTVPTPFRDLFADEKTQGPAMVWLPGGTFLMGSPEGVGGDDEHPQHEVTLEHYAVGQYPVTVGEFRRFVEATGHRTEAEQGDGAYVWNKKDRWEKTKDASWRKPYFDQTDQNPVVCLSWNDAKAYCDWLGEQTGQAYGLLTEAQWEHACRAGSNARYCYGDDEAGLGEYAWYSNNANSQTHPVGEKKPNAWQLYDLHGNVWEWCADWWASDYYQQFTSKPQHPASASEQSASGSASGREVPPFEKGGLGGISSENPSGPASGSYRVVRGGSWYNDADYCRSACRFIFAPANRYYNLGFRLSRTGPLPSYPFTLGDAEQGLSVRPSSIRQSYLEGLGFAKLIHHNFHEIDIKGFKKIGASARFLFTDGNQPIMLEDCQAGWANTLENQKDIKKNIIDRRGKLIADVRKVFESLWTIEPMTADKIAGAHGCIDSIKSSLDDYRTHYMAVSNCFDKYGILDSSKIMQFSHSAISLTVDVERLISKADTMIKNLIEELQGLSVRPSSIQQSYLEGLGFAKLIHHNFHEIDIKGFKNIGASARFLFTNGNQPIMVEDCQAGWTNTLENQKDIKKNIIDRRDKLIADVRKVFESLWTIEPMTADKIADAYGCIGSIKSSLDDYRTHYMTVSNCFDKYGILDSSKIMQFSPSAISLTVDVERLISKADTMIKNLIEAFQVDSR
ncbi:MAG: formylglycine-generating enzyme family protein [Proteobacteria bacterium]|nr:formylglycine-generating enzyme family protein [Pseudomonadota bacterium]